MCTPRRTGSTGDVSPGAARWDKVARRVRARLGRRPRRPGPARGGVQFGRSIFGHALRGLRVGPRARLASIDGVPAGRPREPASFVWARAAGPANPGWVGKPLRGRRASATGLVVDFYNGSRQIGPTIARNRRRHRSQRPLGTSAPAGSARFDGEPSCPGVGVVRRSAQQLVHLLSWGAPVEGFSGSAVEFGGDVVESAWLWWRGRCPWGSTAAAGRWCSRCCRAATASGDRRSRPGPRSDGEVGWRGHLAALVPGQRAAQLLGQSRDLLGQLRDHRLGLASRPIAQQNIAGVALDERRDHDRLALPTSRSPSQWPGTAGRRPRAGARRWDHVGDPAAATRPAPRLRRVLPVLSCAAGRCTVAPGLHYSDRRSFRGDAHLHLVGVMRRNLAAICRGEKRSSNPHDRLPHRGSGQLGRLRSQCPHARQVVGPRRPIPAAARRAGQPRG